ncbi:hypothetical protein WJX82_006045 [Trebouxia sp. C0006]
MITRRASRSNELQTVSHHAQSIPLPEVPDTPARPARATLSVADEWPQHHVKLSEGRKGSGTDSLRYIKLHRHQPWVPASPKNILKFATWDTGKEQFYNSPKDRLQARIMVFLIEKLEEVCGPGSSNDVFLKCLVKTRQWQDTQILNRSDPKPWLAYYRTLGCLDAERISSRGITENQGEAFQQQAGYLPSDLDLAAIQLSDEMLEPLPSRLPVAQDWLGHGTAQAQGQQQGSLAETNEDNSGTMLELADVLMELDRCTEAVTNLEDTLKIAGAASSQVWKGPKILMKDSLTNDIRFM